MSLCFEFACYCLVENVDCCLFQHIRGFAIKLFINPSTTAPKVNRSIINSPIISSLSSMASPSIYTCKECSINLNLSPSHLYPPTFSFDAGNKNTLSFSSIEPSKFRLEQENKLRPFFETVNYWGIQRKRTKIKCGNCGILLGYVYDDGVPLGDGIGQLGFGPSQVIPRAPRYRFKIKALNVRAES
ncbi:hypothetical protein Droror1_Dr00005209 [Drosera rotundifolia]